MHETARGGLALNGMQERETVILGSRGLRSGLSIMTADAVCAGLSRFVGAPQDAYRIARRPVTFIADR